VQGMAPGMTPQGLMEQLAIPFVQAVIRHREKQGKAADKAQSGAGDGA